MCPRLKRVCFGVLPRCGLLLPSAGRQSVGRAVCGVFVCEVVDGAGLFRTVCVYSALVSWGLSGRRCAAARPGTAELDQGTQNTAQRAALLRLRTCVLTCVQLPGAWALRVRARVLLLSQPDLAVIPLGRHPGPSRLLPDHVVARPFLIARHVERGPLPQARCLAPLAPLRTLWSQLC